MLIWDSLLCGACGSSSMPALQGRGAHLMCENPKAPPPSCCVSPPSPRPKAEAGPLLLGRLCSPCRTHVQGDLYHHLSVQLLSPGTCCVQGTVPALQSRRNRSRTPIPFRRIPCILGLLLCAVHLLCASTAYAGRRSAGAERSRQSQCSSLEAWVARQRVLGREAGRCGVGGGTSDRPPPPRGLLCWQELLGLEPGGRGRHSRLAQPQLCQPDGALEGNGSSPEVTVSPNPLRGFLPLPFPQRLRPVWASKCPGMEGLSGESCPWFSYRLPRGAVTLGFLSSPANLGANPELGGNTPLQNGLPAVWEGASPWGDPGVWLGDGG